MKNIFKDIKEGPLSFRIQESPNGVDSLAMENPISEKILVIRNDKGRFHLIS